MERIGATPFVLQLQVTSAAARPKVKEQGNVCFRSQPFPKIAVMSLPMLRIKYNMPLPGQQSAFH